ncbi:MULTISPECIES: hypothetical protein [Streptomyces]|nr:MULTISPECIES: hypothetical protein [Streptomyces]
MSGTQTFTTQTGTYSYSVSEGENGETIYDLSRVFQDGALPVGAIVIHPDYNPFPEVPGLLNVQFGKGGAERDERTDVPMLGEELEAAFIIGHQLVNPADLDVDPEAEKESAPKVRFLRGHLRAAATEVKSPSTTASKATFLAVQDLVTELVKIYRADKATAKREAKYGKFLDAQRAEVLAPQIKEVDDLIKALQLKKAQLTEKLNGHKAA